MRKLRKVSNVSFAWPGAGHLNGPFVDIPLERARLRNQALNCL